MLVHPVRLLCQRPTRPTRCHLTIHASDGDTPPTTLPTLITHQLRRARAALTAPLIRAAQRQRLTTLLRTQGGRAVCFLVPVFDLDPGDVVLICGDNQALGRWDPQGAPVISLEVDESGEQWQHATRLPPGRFMYKVRRAVCMVEQECSPSRVVT